MKKKIFILLIALTSLIFMSALFYGSGNPLYGDTHSNSGCHENVGGYTISANVSSTISVVGSSIIFFDVNASGSDLFIRVYPGVEDNNLFIINPTTDRINDGDPEDNDPSTDILVTFNITAPSTNGYYVIFIIAGDSAEAQPPFAILEIAVSVGGVAAPGFDFSKILDHWKLYLGLPALILISLGTVLVLVNENKFVKVHGILAGSSWILTVVNLGSAIVRIPIESWINVVPQIYYHIPHMILGSLGLISGFLSMLFGIAAERKPALITGYITLVSWWASFVLGYIMFPNLLLL